MWTIIKKDIQKIVTFLGEGRDTLLNEADTMIKKNRRLELFFSLIVILFFGCLMLTIVGFMLFVVGILLYITYFIPLIPVLAIYLLLAYRESILEKERVESN